MSSTCRTEFDNSIAVISVFNLFYICCSTVKFNKAEQCGMSLTTRALVFSAIVLLYIFSCTMNITYFHPD